MKQRSFILFLSLAGFFLLGGCGGGGGTSGAALHDSQECIACHDGDNWKTPGSGQPIVAEWKASTHNTNDGAGCKDCHGSGYMHPESCNKCHSVGITASNPRLNPDADGMCANCHAKVNPRPGKFDGFNLLTYSDPKIPTGRTTAYTHFSSTAGTVARANYVATNYKMNCRKCHNPHDTAYGREQRKQWAESGHGSTVAANANRDFKISGSSIPAKDNFGSYCVRCHTSTGYLNYVTSGFSDVRALPDFNGYRYSYPTVTSPAYVYSDKSRETVNCNVCHDDARSSGESAYSGRVRVVGAVTTYYNYSTSPLHRRSGTNPLNSREGKWDVKLVETYPDYSSSNVCIPCHGGREIGKVIRKSAELLNNYSSTAYRGIFAHDRSAASTMNSISGFEFYTDRSRYLDPNLRHNSLNSIPSTGPNAGRNNGPCITCHMENESSHHFLPVVRSDEDNIQSNISSVIGYDRVCSGCHNSAWDINESKTGYRKALTALQKLVLLKFGIVASATTTPTGVTTSASASAVTGSTITYGNRVWTKLGRVPSTDPALDGLGMSAYTIGAVFNLEMFQLDPGAYAHNPLYVRRLIYDSIDWLYDTAMDVNLIEALDYLVVQYGLDNTKGVDSATRDLVLRYLCKSAADPNGTLGVRP